MTDVMEIVNKFLNRENESSKLKAIAAEAEKRLHVSFALRNGRAHQACPKRC